MPAPTSAPPSARILIVDDDRMNIRILEGILKREGYTLFSTETAEEALGVYPSYKPDLVLLDVMLPGIDGFETCRRLRTTYGDDCAPILFITAKAESEDVVAGFNAGGADYLPKPFRAKEALVRIRTHLERRFYGAQLRAANEAKNKFLGMCAHDLRNPLASIRGLAEFLHEPSIGPLNAEQADIVASIHGASQAMLDLVNELLDITTIEAGELRLALTPAPLRELADKAIRLASIEAARKGTRIELDPSSACALVPVDAARIRQVIDNLLSNAVKYSPPGSHVSVRVEQVGSPAPAAVLSVRDQGPGIPESERGRLFQDFGRLSVKPTGGEKSTGLGLAICRKIVEAHHGRIEAVNQPAGGCVFSFYLPIASA
jgi:two-component system, sensor histidine kinase and response regulator